jgi:hypothetical protein
VYSLPLTGLLAGRRNGMRMYLRGSSEGVWSQDGSKQIVTRYTAALWGHDRIISEISVIRTTRRRG